MVGRVQKNGYGRCAVHANAQQPQLAAAAVGRLLALGNVGPPGTCLQVESGDEEVMLVFVLGGHVAVGQAPLHLQEVAELGWCE